MYNENEENLFGWDMRHRPPITILPTEEHGWGNSHGRLAYSNMNRSQEWNYSEYAIKSMGMMPKNYVIVNISEVKINRDTAFKCGHNRVAIPVKEFARQKHLSLKEQWELMNPQWVGTYFGYFGEDPYRSRRPTFERAMQQAMDEDRFDEFMSQFWSAEYGHKKAIQRLERRADNLSREADSLYRQFIGRQREASKVENDINKGQLERYHLQGYNAHEYLEELKREAENLYWRYRHAESKAKKIREYIDSITY